MTPLLLNSTYIVPSLSYVTVAIWLCWPLSPWKSLLSDYSMAYFLLPRHLNVMFPKILLILFYRDARWNAGMGHRGGQGHSLANWSSKGGWLKSVPVNWCDLNGKKMQTRVSRSSNVFQRKVKIQIFPQNIRFFPVSSSLKLLKYKIIL